MPILGNYIVFKKLYEKFGFYHLVWKELTNIYGPVVGLRLGLVNAILVSGRKAVREVLTREEFDGRPNGFLFKFRTFGKKLGIVFTEGEFWTHQKYFCLKNLRNFGFGKREDMEKQIISEAIDFVQILIEKSNNGEKSIQMSDIFDIPVINVLWAMIADKKFNLGDEKTEFLLKSVHETFRLMDISGGILNQMPFLRFIAPTWCGYNHHKKVLEDLREFFEEIIQEHERSKSDFPRDFIDSFLENMDSKTNFTREQLLSICLDLFFAGSETTSSTLSFSILYMIKYPDVQKKCQEEIDKVLGNCVWPSLRDRSKLPYVEAVLFEVQRLVPLAPTGIPHSTTKDTKLFSHTIPKNTVILVNLYSLQMDPDYWQKPEVFNPNRFLDESGKLIKPQEEWFAPFGYGHRRCLGEQLAKANIFLFFTIILKTFNIEKPENYQLPQPDCDDGFTLVPKSYYANLKLRT